MNLNKISDTLGKIKDLKRTGWINRKVSNPESVADHSYGVALLAYLLCPKELNKQKCLEFAIIHDLAEIIVGDITPGDNVPAEVKRAKEEKAIKEIAQNLNRLELADIFLEYERQDTPEAQFIKKIDRLEAVAQAKYYTDNERTTLFEEQDIGFKSLYDEFSSNHKETIAPIVALFDK